MGKRKALGCSNIEQEDADVDATNSPSKRVREELIVDPCDVPTDKPAMCPSSEEKEKTGSSGKRKRDDQGMHPGIDASAFDGEGGSKRTRIKWASDDAQFKMLGPIQLPDFVKEPIVGANLAIEIQRLNMHLAVINRKLQESGVPDDFLGEDRSVYLPPDVDFLGNRINSRQAMHHEKLIWQRQRIISRLILMNPTFKPPPACKPEKLYKKLYIPLKEYPECNFTGLIIGPRGSTLKRMERETGARIRVKGKGLLKEGRAHCKDPMENEDLHVLIEAENNKSLDAAVEMVEKLLVPCNEGINDHKVAQLKELAELNIMCRVCGGLGHKQNMCPCRSSVARGTDYPDTASVMGSKMEQRHSFLGGRPPFVDASSVPIHASWAYHPASGASPFYMPYSGSTTAMKNKIDKENNESNLYVGYLPRTVDDGRLIQLFSPFGRLISAKVVRDKKTGLSKGIGFVKFVNPVDAARAVARMNGHKIDGRILVVRVAGRLHGASLNYRTSVSTGIDHRIMDMRPKYMHLNNPKQLERPAATESVQSGPHASTTKSCNFESACSPVHTAQTGSFCSQLPLSCGSSAQFQISPCCMNERASPNWPNNGPPERYIYSQFHLSPASCSSPNASFSGWRSPSWARAGSPTHCKIPDAHHTRTIATATPAYLIFTAVTDDWPDLIPVHRMALSFSALAAGFAKDTVVLKLQQLLVLLESESEKDACSKCTNPLILHVTCVMCFHWPFFSSSTSPVTRTLFLLFSFSCSLYMHIFPRTTTARRQ